MPSATWDGEDERDHSESPCSSKYDDPEDVWLPYDNGLSSVPR